MTEKAAASNKRNECFFTGKLQSLTPYNSAQGESRLQLLVVIPAEDEFSYPTRVSIRTSGNRTKHYTPLVNQRVEVKAYAVTTFRSHGGREYDSTSLYEIE